MRSIRNELLEIFFEEGGPTDGPTVMILHGWPDAPRGWREVRHRLESEGYRTISPYLRGTQPTRFLHSETPRDGSAAALTRDAMDLADSLGLEQIFVVGHDWGARMAYTMAALYPERLKAIAALALAFQPRGEFKIPGFEQSRRFWYQWFQCVIDGAESVRRDPVGFARIQWETWSPAGWFDTAEFEKTQESFLGPDWAEITLNAYRSRWMNDEAKDERYADLRERLRSIEKIAVPTLMIQGESDLCDAPEESEGMEKHFEAEYRRVLLPGVGHFPHREAAEEVANHLLGWLKEHA
jgi:pimeloyl-ACP methyl ester carboxylesterase